MSDSSSRRVLSRNNKTSENDDKKHSSETKTSSSNSQTNLKQQPKELETSLNHSIINTQIVNYLNKEPFNEDIEIEESYLFQDNVSWKGLVLDKIKDCVETMKIYQSNPVENKTQIKECYKNGLLLFASLKKLNRLSQMRVNKSRVRTHEEKLKIDEHHLELQNLLYEISHLRKEINTCLEFRSLDENINLIPLDEFFVKAPKEINGPELVTNEHKLKLAQLDWELTERQNMTSRIKDLESQIDQREKQIKLKQSKLESLHPKLNQIIDACKPTLEYFNTHFEENCMFSEPVQYLPKPLYQFYMMMSAYRDTIDKDVKIEVCGDLDDAKRYNLNETINFDDDDSESDGENETENDNYKKKKSKSKSKQNKTNNNEKVFNSFPLSCKVTFSVRGFGQFALEFFYLSFLKIVTIKSEVRLLKDISFSDKVESIFNNLYENDNGHESPNMTNKFLLNNLGIKSIEPHLKNIGMPYKWCQILCGLFYENKTDRQNMIASSLDKQINEPNLQTESSDEMVVDEDKNESKDEQEQTNDYLNDTKIFEQIINRLKSRFKARITLQEAINSLKNCVIPTSDAFMNLRFKVQSNVCSFKETTYEKCFSNSYSKHLFCMGIDEDNWNFYELNLKNQTATLQAHITVHQDYPRITPLFAINVNWKHDRNYLNDDAIRDMEREINVYKDNFIHDETDDLKSFKRPISAQCKHGMDEKHYHILAKQINHLLICFDVYLESESFYLNDSEFPRTKLFPNSVKGRDRKRPYSYMASKDLFLQRMQNEVECGE